MRRLFVGREFHAANHERQFSNDLDDSRLSRCSGGEQLLEATPAMPCLRQSRTVRGQLPETHGLRFLAPAQGHIALTSPPAFLAALQTLFLALLSLGAFGEPSSADRRVHRHVAQERAAVHLASDGRSVAAEEEVDRSDPQQGGGTAHVAAEWSLASVPPPASGLLGVLRALSVVERFPRTHPATGPPLV